MNKLLAALLCAVLLGACSNPSREVAAGAPAAPPEQRALPAEHVAPQQEKSAVAEAAPPEALKATAAPSPRAAMDSVAAKRGRSSFREMRGAMYDRVAPEVNRERYGSHGDNPVKLVAQEPVSTFSVDVDTGSYANVRRMLSHGQLPPKDAVRVEEMINYFPYHYALPQDGKPFAVHTALAPAPWNAERVLLRVALKGADIAKQTLPPANLVFLVDVSGSMDSDDKLPLLRSSLKLLVDQLREQDRISLVTYAGTTAVVLSGTPGSEKKKIAAAIDQLGAGGSTAGGAGIQLAYQQAQEHFIKGGINRILLATDGDFNVGITDFAQLKQMIEEKRKSGVSFTTLGFGSGNYNEQLMEQLADAGNGAYSYIDSLMEGKKVLVNEMTSTLATIAKDVKIQVEFNPQWVTEYRLIGYENRVLRREDFNNDKVDAGDIGAGHT
ncbi:MAG: VWA domain-containing protein, partial [Zoogloeaceae bacterium]|nr:VWA domain-containing protein [Zoogloeaceae bacterium]